MATQVLIYGFIECCVGEDAYNSAVLSSFYFDPVYPFSDIFSLPKPGYHASIIAFAGAYKNLEPDLGEWVQRFEVLISSLRATTAAIRASSDEFGEIASIDYVCQKSVGVRLNDDVPLLWHRYTNTSAEERNQTVEDVLRPAFGPTIDGG